MKKLIFLIASYCCLSASIVSAQVGFGNGSDGPLTVLSGTTTLPLVAQRVNSQTGNSLQVANSGLFPAGSPVLIIQMTGVGAGTNEYAIVSGVSPGTVSFSSLAHTYLGGATQLIKLWQFTKVKIEVGGVLTTDAYNASTGIGGVLCFLANDTVFIKAGGSLRMTGKGFQGTSGGLGGQAGAGGAGGVPSLNNGGNGAVAGIGNVGSCGGGYGAQRGGLPTTGGVPAALGCPGCGPSASNASDIGLRLFVIGGAGKGGNGGAGGNGAGGGGAGGGNGSTLMGSAGGSGAAGGNGGFGGNGGNGGGAIIFKARRIQYSGSPIARFYFVDGTNGSYGGNATGAGNGGNGGAGAGIDVCAQTGGSGGAGKGGGGGSGGDGGASGAGGILVVTKGSSNRAINSITCSMSGGNPTLGGTSGAGGLGGSSYPTSIVNPIPCPPLPGGGSSNGGGTSVGAGGGTDFYENVCDLTVFQSYFGGLTSNGTGVYTGVLLGDPYRCTVDRISALNVAPRLFQCSCRRTDNLGNNYYTTGVIANDLGDSLPSLVGLLDSQGYVFASDELTPLASHPARQWHGVCTTGSGQSGPDGIGGANGLYGGMGWFLEEVENFVLASNLLLESYRQGDQVKLVCTVPSNFDRFPMEVQRSSDGIEFHGIGEMAANGMLEAKRSYLDHQPFAGQNYYRVVTVDPDGAVIESNVEMVAFSGIKLDFVPNPVNSVLFVKGIQGSDATFQISDGTGIIVKAGSLDGMQIYVGDVEAGVYVVAVNCEGEIRRAKIVVLRE